MHAAHEIPVGITDVGVCLLLVRNVMVPLSESSSLSLIGTRVVDYHWVLLSHRPCMSLHQIHSSNTEQSGL